MLDKYFEAPFTLEQLRNGPSAPWLDSFAQYLHAEGYAWWTSRTYLRAAHHFGHFLKIRGVALAAVQPDIVVAFRRHLKRCRCLKPRGGRTEDTVRGAEAFVRYLRTAGVIAQVAKPSWPPLVAGFCHWLSCHRGVSETTLSRYSAAAVELLSELSSDPEQYDAECIRSLLLNRARRRGAGGTRAFLSAVRLFLRYLATQGKCSPGLDAEQLVAACDLTLALGLRDRAIILLLARLGLRASDVAALRLTHVDWSEGSLIVKGKSRRESRLPLPQEVGDAMLAYLEHRPRVADEHAFLRSVAPFRALPASSVSQVVRRAMRRAGVIAPAYGSHILRHTAATEMLRNGVSLYDIGSVLRHRSADMSAYHAKVDMALLKQVVQPWPEVLSC